jgi:hypothetical protein
MLPAACGGERESRAASLTAKATEGVESLDCSLEELPGVGGSERSEGGGGNGEAPPWPGACGERRSVAGNNRRPGNNRRAGRESTAAVVPLEPARRRARGGPPDGQLPRAPGAPGLHPEDIASCFEAIPHDRLMQAIEDRICGRRLLRLLGAMLHAGYGGGRGQAQRHRHAAGRISIRVPIEPRPSAAARSTRFSRAT